MDRNSPHAAYAGSTLVALRKESVDRNLQHQSTLSGVQPSLSARRAWIEIRCRTSICSGWIVALRKESVDRNIAVVFKSYLHCVSLSARRAWIEITSWRGNHRCAWSLSARRAWIEISTCGTSWPLSVSLSARRAWIEIRKYHPGCLNASRSLSARRAWIEIKLLILYTKPFNVALRKESVDRNLGCFRMGGFLPGRSPQGERG